MEYATEAQRIVVERRVKDGYEVLGKVKNIHGVKGLDVCIVKGRHTMHINALGYDSYTPGVIYKIVE